MVGAVIIVLVATFLWAITNHIDKYMLCNIKNNSSNVKTLLLFSSFIAGSLLSQIWLIINKFQVVIILFR